MVRKFFNGIVWMAKKNISFFLGIVFGATVGTLTTIFLLMGFYDPSVLTTYQQVLCGG
jgi:hypothetical protein